MTTANYMTHNKKNLDEHIPLKVRQKSMHKFTPVGPQNNVAKTLVAVICNQLNNNIPYIFRHCDPLLDLNKIHKKKLQENVLYRLSH